VKYIGAFSRGRDPRIGIVEHGKVYEVSEEVGKVLLSTGQYKEVREKIVEPKIKTKEEKPIG